MSKQTQEKRREILAKVGRAMQPKHTPLPWSWCHRVKGGVEAITIWPAKDGLGRIGTLLNRGAAEEEANGQLICVAVNHHKRLVEALEHFLMAYTNSSLDSARENATKLLVEIAAANAPELPADIERELRAEVEAR